MKMTSYNKKFVRHSKKHVPGYQITGMYEDSKCFVRIPTNWNGKLVVSASRCPVTRQDAKWRDRFRRWIVRTG